jgi:hypothetical protein
VYDCTSLCLRWPQLAAGERIVAVGGAHSGRFGTVVGLALKHPDAATLLQRAVAPYRVKFDDDDADDCTVPTHELRRVDAASSQMRIVHDSHGADGEEHDSLNGEPPPTPTSNPASAASTPRATPTGEGGGAGRRAWTVEEVGSVPAAADEPTDVTDEQQQQQQQQLQHQQLQHLAARAAEAGGAHLYECVLPVHALMAGRSFDLPLAAGLVPLHAGRRHIRFQVPEQVLAEHKAAWAAAAHDADDALQRSSSHHPSSDTPRRLAKDGAALRVPPPVIVIQALLKPKHPSARSSPPLPSALGSARDAPPAPALS